MLLGGANPGPCIVGLQLGSSQALNEPNQATSFLHFVDVVLTSLLTTFNSLLFTILVSFHDSPKAHSVLTLGRFRLTFSSYPSGYDNTSARGLNTSTDRHVSLLICTCSGALRFGNPANRTIAAMIVPQCGVHTLPACYSFLV